MQILPSKSSTYLKLLLPNNPNHRNDQDNKDSLIKINSCENLDEKQKLPICNLLECNTTIDEHDITCK
jgi:hypothetical protein